ncbi:hypothetical protein G7Y89_g2853 [Cudoniella acicularis]|uniref:Uncharacterized protein n=1 Tax=Cudoniella acicularis TaxID=354080 RepID=A0A8H4W649_9HELO|nr:hypothetical protein G7Y89_g2853 [Cudoniella acicularis]
MPQLENYEVFLEKQVKSGKPRLKLEEAAAIREFFQGKATPAEAATRFTSDVTSATKRKGAEASLRTIWVLIENLGARFPEQHDKLIQLMEAIIALPDMILGSECIKMLTFSLTEGWDNTPTERINRVAFEAKLYKHDIFITSYNGFSILSETFEYSPSTPPQLDTASNRKLSVDIQLAEKWILNAGEKLFTCTDIYENCRFETAGGLWKGAKGFSRKRWAFWRQRASEIGSWKELGSETREAAWAIVEVMESIEGEAGW